LIDVIRNSKYDCVINIQRFAASGLLTLFSGAKLKIGFNKNPFSLFYNKKVKHTIKKGNRHEIERNLDLVRIISDETTFPVKLYPTQKDFAKMSQYKTIRFITISPASLWYTKQYPKEKWIEFIKSTTQDIRIYFLGSKNEYTLAEEIINESGHINSLNLTGKLSFLESAVIMKDAVMNFVNDSAPMHLASSVNAPTTAIYCSTVASFGFGPLSENSMIVETKEVLNCRPCGLHGLRKCPKKHFKCALTIDNNDLIKRIG
jgi:heptosyltransferase-2